MLKRLRWLALSVSVGTLACSGMFSTDNQPNSWGVAGSAIAAGNAGNGGGAAGSAAASGGAPAAGSAGAAGAPVYPCLSDSDCPISDLCQTCADGSAVCGLRSCISGVCVDLSPTCNCAPSKSGSGFRCSWQMCDGIACPTGTSCQCCGGFVRGCLCTSACTTNADCSDPVRPVCDQGVCSDGAFLCCGCP